MIQFTKNAPTRITWLEIMIMKLKQKIEQISGGGAPKPIQFIVGEIGAPSSGDTTYHNTQVKTNMDNGFTPYLYKNGYGYMVLGTDYTVNNSTGLITVTNPFFTGEPYSIIFYPTT